MAIEISWQVPDNRLETLTPGIHQGAKMISN